MIKLVEVEPGRWRVDKPTAPPARSDLPRPYVISDAMPETEHVDGRFYASKSQFRAVTKAQGLIEVGNEKPKPRQKASNQARNQKARREALEKAAAQYRAGRRAQQV